MKRTAIALVAVALASPAGASDFNVRFGRLPPVEYVPIPRVVHVPPPRNEAEAVARDAAIARWTAHCNPVDHVDRFGVTRLTYDHPGCEFGEGEHE